MYDQLYEDETLAADTANAIATKPASDVDIEKLNLEGLALAKFGPAHAALAEATAKLTDVVHDLSTATKLAEAKSLRERLINAPLADARKTEKALKSKLTATSKAVGAALTTIEAGFTAAAKHITPQIEARDAELAAEKAEREAKEAERTGVHRANIAKLASYVGQAQGKTSAQILTIINGVSGIEIIPEQWEEFAVGAEIQKTETLETLQVLFNATKTAEDAAAAREAQRIENERIAAELVAREAELAAKQAEIDRKLAALAAAEKAEADRIEAAAQAQRDAEAKAQADAEAAARQAAEEEANRMAQEAADAEAQVSADAAAAFFARTDVPSVEPILITVYASPEQLSDDALTAMPSIADEVPSVASPVAHTRMAVSPGLLHPTHDPADMGDVLAQPWTDGGVEFAGDEPSPSALTALLAHIDEAFTGKFAAHPKPPREWWGALRRLSDEAREHVAA